MQALAFRTGSQWQVVVINTNAAGSAPASFGLQLPGGGQLQAAGTYQTSATGNLTKVASPPVQGSTAALTTPAQSITTYLIGQSG